MSNFSDYAKELGLSIVDAAATTNEEINSIAALAVSGAAGLGAAAVEAGRSLVDDTADPGAAFRHVQGKVFKDTSLPNLPAQSQAGKAVGAIFEAPMQHMEAGQNKMVENTGKYWEEVTGSTTFGGVMAGTAATADMLLEQLTKVRTPRGPSRQEMVAGPAAVARRPPELQLRFVENEKAGIDPFDNLAETGIWRGQDGVLRTWIDDSRARLRPGAIPNSVFQSEGASHTTTLGAILTHPEMYKVYPDMKDVKVEIVRVSDQDIAENKMMVETGVYGAYYNPNARKIVLKVGKEFDPKAKQQTFLAALHEANHDIQEQEMMSAGWNETHSRKAREELGLVDVERRLRAALRNYDKYGTYSDLNPEEVDGARRALAALDDYKNYMNNLGEKESRITTQAAETGMSPEQASAMALAASDKTQSWTKEAVTIEQYIENTPELWGDKEALTWITGGDDKLIEKYGDPNYAGDDSVEPLIMGRPASSVIAEQRTFHGSRTGWEGDPSVEHMGKGEGAQVYGWGLYSAGRLMKTAVEHYWRKFKAEEGERKGKAIAEATRSRIRNDPYGMYGTLKGLFPWLPEVPAGIRKEDLSYVLGQSVWTSPDHQGKLRIQMQRSRYYGIEELEQKLLEDKQKLAEEEAKRAAALADPDPLLRNLATLHEGFIEDIKARVAEAEFSLSYNRALAKAEKEGPSAKDYVVNAITGKALTTKVRRNGLTEKDLGIDLDEMVTEEEMESFRKRIKDKTAGIRDEIYASSVDIHAPQEVTPLMKRVANALGVEYDHEVNSMWYLMGSIVLDTVAMTPDPDRGVPINVNASVLDFVEEELSRKTLLITWLESDLKEKGRYDPEEPEVDREESIKRLTEKVGTLRKMQAALKDIGAEPGMDRSVVLPLDKFTYTELGVTLPKKGMPRDTAHIMEWDVPDDDEVYNWGSGQITGSGSILKGGNSQKVIKGLADMRYRLNNVIRPTYGDDYDSVVLGSPDPQSAYSLLKWFDDNEGDHFNHLDHEISPAEALYRDNSMRLVTLFSDKRWGDDYDRSYGFQEDDSRKRQWLAAADAVDRGILREFPGLDTYIKEQGRDFEDIKRRLTSAESRIAYNAADELTSHMLAYCGVKGHKFADGWARRGRTKKVTYNHVTYGNFAKKVKSFPEPDALKAALREETAAKKQEKQKEKGE